MTDRILPILGLIVAIGIFALYIDPTWNGPVAAAKAAIANDNQALAAANDYNARQNELASEQNAINPADLGRLTDFLPDSVNNVGIILDLNALAARTGLSLTNVDVAPLAGTGSATTPASSLSRIGSINLSISAAGTYAALQSFLDGVEQSERLLDVEDLLIKGSDTGVYTYKMTLRLYWLR